METKALLEVKNLDVHYRSARILKEVSITVHEGEIVAVLGANGAGKTSLLRTILGLTPPSSGDIWFGGKKINELPTHERVKMGIACIPEGRRIFAELTVEQNLYLGAYSCRTKEKITTGIKFVYKLFPVLSQRCNQLAGTLSGGEQQMLAIGRALMSNPKLLLMDEPTLGLSPLLVREVGRAIQNIASQSRLGILLVEQNALFALRLASRAYVLELGKVVFHAESSALYNNERLRRAYLGI